MSLVLLNSLFRSVCAAEPMLSTDDRRFFKARPDFSTSCSRPCSSARPFGRGCVRTSPLSGSGRDRLWLLLTAAEWNKILQVQNRIEQTNKQNGDK